MIELPGHANLSVRSVEGPVRQILRCSVSDRPPRAPKPSEGFPPQAREFTLRRHRLVHRTTDQRYAEPVADRITARIRSISEGRVRTKDKKKAIRTKQSIKEYTYLGCPLTRNRSAWCFRICVPDQEGQGRCGRVAPHGLKGRTQVAIELQNRKQRRTHLENLERVYLAEPCNEGLGSGINISEGETDIVLPIRTELLDAAGRIQGSIGIKAMNDAALCAVSSLVTGEVALTVNFSASLSGAVPSGELLARGRFVGMSGSDYLAESILVDSEGIEIGRGDGRFVRSDILEATDTEAPTG